MRTPKTVTVLGRPISIRTRPKKSMPDAFGEWHAEPMEIRLRAGQLPFDLTDTLLHEVMHAVLHCQGREFGGETEELYVRALATGVLQTLRANPELTAWLTRPITEKTS